MEVEQMSQYQDIMKDQNKSEGIKANKLVWALSGWGEITEDGRTYFQY